MSSDEENVARSRRTASHTSRTGAPASGAYARYSAASSPNRPLSATKHGWPSVMPDSIAWKSAWASSLDGVGSPSLNAVAAIVEMISSRYPGSTSSLRPRVSRSSRNRSSASRGMAMPPRCRVIDSASTCQWSSASRSAVKR